MEGVEQFCVLGVRADTGHHKARMRLPGRRKPALSYEHITLVLNRGKLWQDEAALAAAARQVRALNASLPAIKRVQRVLVTPEAFETAGGF